MSGLGEWGDDPSRNANAQAVSVELRRRDVLEVTARLVVRQDVGGAAPGRRLLQRGDELLLDAHADRDVGGRVLVPAVCVTGDDERHLRQFTEMEVVEVLAFAATSALVIGPS